MDEIEDYEEKRKAAVRDAKMLQERERKREARRNKIRELEKNMFEKIESTEGDKLNIKPSYIEPKIEVLTPEELSESISRSLVPENPYCDTKRVIFDYREGAYKKFAIHSKEVLLYELSGSVVPAGSQEAAEQAVRQEVDEEWREMISQRNESTRQMVLDKAMAIREARRVKEAAEVEEELGEEEEEPVKEEEPPPPPAAPTPEDQAAALRVTLRLSSVRTMPVEESRKKKLLSQRKFMNRFTFSERSVLTYDTLSRDKFTQTYPTMKKAINGQVSQWFIYESYDKDYSALLEAKEKERLAKMTMKAVKEDKTIKKPPPEEDPIFKRMTEGIIILERMLNQNIYDNIAQDCAFYEDPGDKYRTEEGLLLPLWEFKYCDAKNIAITDIKWNPAYKDLFGVTFGMMDFTEPSNKGYLCIFTLKNPSFPEFVKKFDAGATCLDFHSNKSYFVCVGLSDGSVVAYNTQKVHCDTQYRSKVEGNNKTMISSVIWSDDPRERYLTFFSAGTDGRICKWNLLENELISSHIITLYVDRHVLSPRCSEVQTHAVPTAIAFYPTDPETFIVGTDIGDIYKCCTSYSSEYLYQMKAHELPVKRITFNTYSPDVFATCGGDWRFKIWEDGRTEPLFLYNLDSPVGDVQWAPYSSTVIAAVTAPGMVYVYDLQFDKYEPACAQYVVCSDDNIATRLRFNPFGLKMPLILIGDSRGFVTTVKISPNLRVKPKPPKKTEFAVHVDDFTFEVRKLEKILAHVKESIVLELPNEDEIKTLVEYFFFSIKMNIILFKFSLKIPILNDISLTKKFYSPACITIFL